jgi:hypothetical protein
VLKKLVKLRVRSIKDAGGVYVRRVGSSYGVIWKRSKTHENI